MRHELSKREYLTELNNELGKLGGKPLDFDAHIVLVEEDWACGREPEDVARRLVEGAHLRYATWSHRVQQAAQAQLTRG